MHLSLQVNLHHFFLLSMCVLAQTQTLDLLGFLSPSLRGHALHLFGEASDQEIPKDAIVINAIMKDAP
jgi:hypothetical protein